MICFKVKNICYYNITFLLAAFMKIINSYELAAFGDFLELNYLKHGIVLRTTKVVDFDNDADNACDVANYKYYEKLLQTYRMQFYRTGNNNNFSTLFYHGMPRVGIFVPSLLLNEIHESVFVSASHNGYFNATQAWFIVAPESLYIVELIENALKSYTINIDADITVAMRVPANKTLQLYDVYKISHEAKTPLIIRYKGFWSKSTGFQSLIEFNASKMLRRRDFGNLTMKAGTALLEKPENISDLAYLANDKDNLQLDPMQRKTYNLLKPMQQMFNMSFEIHFTDAWGLQLETGNWTGVIGHLLAHEVDFSICPLRFTLDRMTAIQYTPELHTQFIHFLLRHPRHNADIVQNIFFAPLSTQVWWCVLAVIIIAMALLALHVKYEQCTILLNGRQCADTRHTVESRFDFVCFTILETTFMQGPATDIFRLISTRLLIFTTCIFSFMLLQFYGAFIVGSLLSDMPRTIVDMKSLYGSNLEIGMENVSYNYLLFTNTSNQLVKDIYTERICSKKHANIIDINRGAERIKAGGFAFHAAIDRMYRILFDLLDENAYCDLQEIMFNPPYTSSAALRKSSPLREYFAFTVLHLRATGLMQYNDKIWIVPKLDCSLIRDQEVEIDLVHFAPALFTLAAAMLCSIFVFLIELLSSRYCHAYKSMRVKEKEREGEGEVKKNEKKIG